MDEVKIETVYGPWYVRAASEPDMRGKVWFRLAGTGVQLSAYISAGDAIALAGKLLAAAGHEDPIPVAEATESDFGAFVEAAQ